MATPGETTTQAGSSASEAAASESSVRDSAAYAKAAGEAVPAGLLPPVEFLDFVHSLAASASYHLGLLADEEGVKGEVNLPLARHTIDLLDMLQAKTKGNLSEDEATELLRLLHDVKMKFVRVAKG